MAEKGWTAQAGAAAGIAAGAGAAQLGLGYGLGVIEWPVTVTASDSTWLNSLGWATWITASATVLGAVIAGRLRADRTGRWRALWRFVLAASAALGALVSVALVALPARSAVRTDTFSPQLVAVGYALIGLFAGVVVAFWAVSSSPVAANLLGTAVWLWALAVAGVAAELATGRDLATYLTSWQFAEAASPVRYGGIYWPSAALTLVAAFVIGLLMVWPAVRRGDLGLGAATSGAVGPLLVAISFLALAPLLTEAAGPLQSAYLIAPYAVLAGLAGSALSVSFGQNRQNRLAGAVPDGGPRPTPALPAAPAETTGNVAVGVAKPTGRVSPRPVTAPVSPTPPTPSAQTKPSAETKPAAAVPAPEKVPAEEKAPAEEAPRRRWLFGKRQPTETEPATPAEPVEPEPKGRARKPRPTRGETAETPVTKPAEKPIEKPAAKPAAKPADDDAFVDPEIAAAARPSKNAAAKRAAIRKDAATRSTITPPPTNPTVARINPKD